MSIYVSHEDENEDRKSEKVLKVYSDDFDEPLIGDYRGVELARIYYNPSRPDSIARAEQIAGYIVAAEQLRGVDFNPRRGIKCSNAFYAGRVYLGTE